jgi:hypothetical protein
MIAFVMQAPGAARCANRETRAAGRRSAVIKEIPESYATAWTCLFRNLDLA